MRSRIPPVAQLAAFACFSLAFPAFGNAQAVFYFGDSLHQIGVSESQDEQLMETQGRLNEEIQGLRDTLRTTQQKLRQQVFERDTKLEKFLNAEQLKSLNKQRNVEALKNAKKNAEFMGEFAEFLEHVSAAGDLRVFEGLPRATDDELAKIKNENKTIEIDGWSFYRVPLSTQPSIVEKLRSTLVDYRAFEPYSGGKFCGGFHPDFCVEWETNGKKYHTLICLTCFESVFVTPNGNTTFDFNDAAWKSFAQVAISTFTKHKNVIEKLDEMLGQ